MWKWILRINRCETENYSVIHRTLVPTMCARKDAHTSSGCKGRRRVQMVVMVVFEHVVALLRLFSFRAEETRRKGSR